MADVTIVGGGLAGLVAAARLAAHGASVIVLDSKSLAGGRAQSPHMGSFLVNAGPRALYCGGPAQQTLDSLAVPYTGKRVSSSNSLVFINGQLKPMPATPLALLSTDLMGWSDKFLFLNLLNNLLSSAPISAPDQSFSSYLDAKKLTGNARSLILALARLSTYCATPDTMPANAVLTQLKMALRQGVLYLDYGWESLISGLGECVLKHDGQIRTSSSVQSIERTADHIDLQLSDGGTVRSRCLILANGLKGAHALLPELEPFVKSTQPCEGFCIDIVLRRLPLKDHTFLLGLDAPFYVSVHSKFATFSHSEKGEVVHLMKYGSYAQPSHAEVEHELEELFELMQPGWRAELLHKRVLPRMTVAHNFPRFGQLEVSLPTLDNVFFAGDYEPHEGHMLADATIFSANKAAERCARSLGGDLSVVT